ncbi:Ig domain-containing protein [Rhodococcus sp. UNC363MFTsu5.1]|uniref:Ig domain-containing protein n=1 Tax=Rhodococcus sp. UNC363MFTsu5.1 TaxID=1449069 RepID=UPI00068B18A5|nr:Ig domain-containing protein [Rhodococcus sp. UNC363MFTsu5.1]
MATVNADATRIWDGAETYVIPVADVPNGDIAPYVPASVNATIDPKWLFVGLQDADAGVPITPELEIVHFDGFGHPRYRSKARRGSVTTGFTAFEDNAVTRKFVLPGSAGNRIGAPKGTRFFVLYRFEDEGYVDILVTPRPALFELSSHSGKTEAGQESYEMTCHHANDANGDVFIRVETAATAPVDDLVITTTSLPAGVIGTPYSQTLTATGGTGAKTWTKTGTLPTGLALSTAGVLSGTPTAAGTPSITFTVTDSATPTADTASKSITVTVTA